MPGNAVERHVCTALAGYDIDHGKRQVEILENRSLLDVKFEVTERIARRLCIGDAVRVETELLDGVAQRAPAFVEAIEQRGIECADKRAAAQEWSTEPHTFLIGESHNLDRKGKPLTSEQLDERNRQDGAQDSVERTGVWNSIEV